MRSLLASAMVWTMALALFSITLCFGGVRAHYAALAAGLVLLLALLWATKLALADVVSWKRSPLHWPVLAFLIYATARYLTSPVEFDSRQEWFVVMLCGLVYFVSAANFYHTRDRRLLLWTLVALALMQSAYGFYQFATKAETVLGIARPPAYYHRGGGTFICPNHLAGFLEMILGLMLGNIAWRRVSRGSIERSALEKVGLVYASVLVLGGVVFTLSRAGWAAAGIGVIIFLVAALWGDWRSRTMWPRIGVTVFGFAVVALAIYSIQPARDYVTLTFWPKQPQEQVALKDPSLGGRTMLWGSTLRIIGEHPFFGTGPGTWQWFHQKHRDPMVWTRPEYAHNDVLNLASDYGLVGFVLGLVALACFFWQAGLVLKTRDSSDERSFALGTMIAVSAIIFHSWFDFNLHIPANALLLATIFGFAAAMDDGRKQFPRRELNWGGRYALTGILVAVVGVLAWFGGRTAWASWQASLGLDAKLTLQWDSAITRFQRAIALNPKAADYYARLGDVLRTQGEWRLGPGREAERNDLVRKAIQQYEQSLKLNPYHSEVWLRLARALELTGEYDRAVNAYEQSLALDPNNFFTYDQLGLHYLRRSSEVSPLDIENAPALAAKLRQRADGVSQYLWDRLSDGLRQMLSAPDPGSTDAARLRTALATDLDKIVKGPSIFEAKRFEGVKISLASQRLLRIAVAGESTPRLNRWLLEDTYPAEITQLHAKADKAFETSVRINNGINDLGLINLRELRNEVPDN